MSAQQKKSEHTSSDQQKDTHFQNIRNSRPNIDHLLKRINGERKQERKNNILMMVVGVFAIGFISLIFTKV
jgi:hypothetical protein